LDYFQAKGYRCIAPAWPDRDKPVQTLQESHPNPHLGCLTLSRFIEHYAGLIPILEAKPILYKKYKRSPSIPFFKEFVGRTHFIIGQPDREEVAGYIAAWQDEKGG
jgi:hypothetical protein